MVETFSFPQIEGHTFTTDTFSTDLNKPLARIRETRRVLWDITPPDDILNAMALVQSAVVNAKYRPGMQYEYTWHVDIVDLTAVMFPAVLGDSEYSSISSVGIPPIGNEVLVFSPIDMDIETLPSETFRILEQIKSGSNIILNYLQGIGYSSLKPKEIEKKRTTAGAKYTVLDILEGYGLDRSKSTFLEAHLIPFIKNSSSRADILTKGFNTRLVRVNELGQPI